MVMVPVSDGGQRDDEPDGKMAQEMDACHTVPAQGKCFFLVSRFFLLTMFFRYYWLR